MSIFILEFFARNQDWCITCYHNLLSLAFPYACNHKTFIGQEMINDKRALVENASTANNTCTEDKEYDHMRLTTTDYH